jgi:uncharacterized RDD family membrane protein YckC
MQATEQRTSKILSVLSHPLRRQILLHLSEEKEATFTDFATAFAVDTGKLSFHLRTLEAFVEQTPAGKYKLSKLGRNAIILIRDVEAWDMEMGASTRPFIRPLAEATERVAAFLIDFVITFTIFLALSNAFYPITFQFILNINLPFFLFLFWGYSTLLESLKGQTLGKQLMHIKVIRTDGKDPMSNQAAVRNIGKAFLLPFDLAVGLSLKDQRFIRFFDKLAGTIVIDLEPKHMLHQKRKKTKEKTKPSEETTTETQTKINSLAEANRTIGRTVF